MRVLALASTILLVTLSACKVYDPLYCDASKPCTDPARPFCDVGGDYPASEGVGHTCIPEPSGAGEPDAGPGAEADAGFSCTPGTILACSDDDTAIFCDDAGREAVTVECGSVCDVEDQLCSCDPDASSCSGDQLIHCGEDGKVEELSTCALGCDDLDARCFELDPSNGLAGYLDMADAAPALTLSSGATIDTTAGTIRNGDGTLMDVPVFQIPAPAGGVAVRVFAVRSLDISDASVTGDRALAIVSDGDILIRGHMLILAGAFTTGSCAGRDSVTVNDPSEPGPFSGATSGGGGGGFATLGASGGSASVGSATSPGSSGGASVGNPALVPLRGGCPGGVLEGQGEFGGAGGGAIQLVSRTGIILMDSSGQASIDAGGRGGPFVGGSGGGSGGGILLEAALVSIGRGTAVAANGGGGAAGCGADGQDASPDGTAAEGGTGCQKQGSLVRYGDGGSGGAGSIAPSPGDSDSHPEPAAIVFAGGGGGAVGRIRINVARPGEFPASGTVSPTASIGPVSTR